MKYLVALIVIYQDQQNKPGVPSVGRWWSWQFCAILCFLFNSQPILAVPQPVNITSQCRHKWKQKWTLSSQHMIMANSGEMESRDEPVTNSANCMERDPDNHLQYGPRKTLPACARTRSDANFSLNYFRILIRILKLASNFEPRRYFIYTLTSDRWNTALSRTGCQW